MSLSCPLVRRLLSRYSDAELSDRQAAQVERHLSVCAYCQRELDTYVETTRLLADAETPEAPGEAWSRLAASLQARGAPGFGEPTAWSVKTRVESHPFRMRLVAVAAIVLVAVGLAVAFPGLIGTFGPQEALAHEIDIESFHDYLDAEEGRFDLRGPFAHAYRVRVVEWEEARKACAAGKGPATELPSGFTLTRTMILETDCCQGVALEYRRGDNWLAVVQIANHHPMEWHGLSHEVRQVGMTDYEVHEEDDLCTLVLSGASVNLLIAGDSDLQIMGEVATFLTAWVESAVSAGASF